MACYFPLDGYRHDVSGAVTIGYDPGNTKEKLAIPCGRCVGCRLERSSMWSVRCRHEADTWQGANAFVTLTYDDEHLPEGETLVPKHLQDWLKRVRNVVHGVHPAPDGKHPVRFFGVGEYGGQTKRPHYHVLLFNARLQRTKRVGEKLYECEEIADTWKMGAHAVGEVTPASAAYVAQYSLAKVRGRVEAAHAYQTLDPVTGEVWDREPEFCRMSRRPGLGAYWYQRFSRDLERGYVVVDGRKVRLPRFYRERLEQDPDVAYRLETAREGFLLKRDPADRTPRRLEDAAEVVKARRRTLAVKRQTL